MKSLNNMGYGVSPACCGELVQGIYRNCECISTYCIDLYSKAYLSQTLESISYREYKKNKKSYDAIKIAAKYMGISDGEINCFKLDIKSEIPRGKGMSSSSSDILSSLKALTDFTGIELDKDRISKIMVSIEPTDPIMYKKLCIYDSKCGSVKKEFNGNIFLGKEVMVLEPKTKISTQTLKEKDFYKKIVSKNRSLSEESFKLLTMGIEENSIDLVSKACINSAIANEGIKSTPHIREIYEVCDKNSCNFVNIAHTGTVVGICLGDNTDREKLVFDLNEKKILKFYDRIHMTNIVEGGK